MTTTHSQDSQHSKASTPPHQEPTRAEPQHIPPGQHPQAQQRAANRSDPVAKTDATFLSVLRHYGLPGEVDADDRFVEERARLAWDAFRVGRDGIAIEQLPGKSMTR